MLRHVAWCCVLLCIHGCDLCPLMILWWVVEGKVGGEEIPRMNKKKRDTWLLSSPPTGNLLITPLELLHFDSFPLLVMRYFPIEYKMQEEVII